MITDTVGEPCSSTAAPFASGDVLTTSPPTATPPPASEAPGDRLSPTRGAWGARAMTTRAAAPCRRRAGRRRTRAGCSRRPEPRRAARRRRPAPRPAGRAAAPTTAASCTAGCSCRTSSISFAPTRLRADLDHVVVTADQIEVAVRVRVAEVAGAVAEGPEPQRGLLRVVPVAARDVRPARDELADLARRRLGCRPRRRPDLDVREWPGRSSPAWRAGRGRQVGQARRRLGGAVHHEEVGPRPALAATRVIRAGAMPPPACVT